jgi:hypothetical protein
VPGDDPRAAGSILRDLSNGIEAAASARPTCLRRAAGERAIPRRRAGLCVTLMATCFTPGSFAAEIAAGRLALIAGARAPRYFTRRPGT